MEQPLENSNSKLVSFRIWNNNLEMLNYLVEVYGIQLSRSFVINKILNTLLSCTPADQIMEILTTMFPDEKCYRIYFKRDEDLLRKKREALLK